MFETHTCTLSKKNQEFYLADMKSDDLEFCVLTVDSSVQLHSTQKCVNPSHLLERPGPQRTY